MRTHLISGSGYGFPRGRRNAGSGGVRRAVRMEMQGGSYGIFEGEIEPGLRRIRRHDDLAEIEATPCPCCGARIRVCIWPDGLAFQVLCSGHPPHFSVLQSIGTPPPWWSRASDRARRVDRPAISATRASADGSHRHGNAESVLPRSGLVVCRACSTAWGCKSPAQPDGGEVLAKRKGVAARRRLKEAWSKTAT